MRQTAHLINWFIKEAGSQDDALQRLIDDLKDVLSRTWTREKRTAIIEAIRNLERFDGPVTEAELRRLESNLSQRLGADFASLVRQPVIEITEAAYLMGMTQAAADTGLGPFGAAIRWNLPDLESLDVLTKNTMFWVGDYYDSQAQDKFKEVLQEFFQGGYSRDQIADLLEDTFAGLGPKTEAYWDLLADHTCTKVREIGRLSGYEQAGVEYLEIRAWLDAKTTPMCRSLHGRIIAVREVRQFVNGYLAACQTGDKEAVKQAWPMWNENRFRSAGIAGIPSGKLVAAGVGLPPYHFRCRTITVSYFEELNSSGLNVANAGAQVTFWDGEKEVKHKITWEYKDKLGRKAIVTNGAKHILRHPEMNEDKINAALKSVTHVGYNKNYPDELVYLSENGVFTVFRGNVVYTQFIPKGKPLKFFRDNALSIIKIGVAKWKLFELFS